jgi:hypothetical protein
MEIRPSKNLPSVVVSEQPGSKASKREAAAQPSSDVAVAQVLEQAITQNKQANATLTRVAGKDQSRQSKEKIRVDVEQSVREAAHATVRDVEAAAELALSLAGSITKEADTALDAQANQETRAVERLLQ